MYVWNTSMHACGGHRSASSVILYELCIFNSESGSLIDLELVKQAGLAGHRDPGIHLAPSLQQEDLRYIPSAQLLKA